VASVGRKVDGRARHGCRLLLDRRGGLAVALGVGVRVAGVVVVAALLLLEHEVGLEVGAGDRLRLARSLLALARRRALRLSGLLGLCLGSWSLFLCLRCRRLCICVCVLRLLFGRLPIRGRRLLIGTI